MLGALGAPVQSPDDAPAALRERELALWRRSIEPVSVAWDGGPSLVELRVPERDADGPVSGSLETDGGEAREFALDDPAAGPAEGVDVHGERFVRRFVALPPLPRGYHRLALRVGRTEGATLVVSAPSRCVAVGARRWGAFLPLYAARGKSDWGCGDLADLGRLREWTASLGGTAFGTLPLLAAFLDEPFEPSPYSPASRLFWNELYVDVTRLSELERSAEARALVSASGFRRDVARARRAKLVDYRLVASLKRRALELLAATFFEHPAPTRQAQFRAFARTRPDLLEYATFRGATERRGVAWPEWDDKGRVGRLGPRDADEATIRYHQYVQFVMEEQLGETSGSRGGPGHGLYLDLPLGVHPAGYDTWRYRDVFALGARGGSPPDAFFARGQDWGFPPLHPENARARGHDYFIAAIRHQLRHAGALRIDHVMGLHRMYWVPPGLDPLSGVYVRYAAEELYAILSLESHRAGAAIVGEDLGTVPRYVRHAMARHGVLRSYVLQLDALDPRNRLPDPPAASLASLDTHDMPPFASFWEGTDVDDRLARGLLDRSHAAAARRARRDLTTGVARALRDRRLLRGRASAQAAMDAAHRFLAASDAEMTVVNLEDLVLEIEPQNRPGTGPEAPNWRRKAAFTQEQLRSDVSITGRLEEINRLRRTHPTDPKKSR